MNTIIETKLLGYGTVSMISNTIARFNEAHNFIEFSQNYGKPGYSIIINPWAVKKILFTHTGSKQTLFNNPMVTIKMKQELKCNYKRFISRFTFNKIFKKKLAREMIQCVNDFV